MDSISVLESISWINPLLAMAFSYSEFNIISPNTNWDIVIKKSLVRAVENYSMEAFLIAPVNS
jgi:hypothetical protein